MRYTASHYIILFETTLHYITLHYFVLHCITLHNVELYCIASNCVALQYTASVDRLAAASVALGLLPVATAVIIVIGGCLLFEHRRACLCPPPLALCNRNGTQCWWNAIAQALACVTTADAIETNVVVGAASDYQLFLRALADRSPVEVGRLQEMSDAAISATGLSSAPQHSPSVLPHLLSASGLGDLFLMSDSPLLPGGVPQTIVTLRKAATGHGRRPQPVAAVFRSRTSSGSLAHATAYVRIGRRGWFCCDDDRIARCDRQPPLELEFSRIVFRM